MTIIDLAKSMNIIISESQAKLLDHFKELVLAKNKTMNLTAITDDYDFLIKHTLDSILALPLIKENSTLLDLGCGGGFPSIPLAIMRKDISVTAIDSTTKKINFVNDAILNLGLNNIKAFSERAEDVGKTKFREKFDYVTARAVASLPMLLELAIPLLKIGGKFIAYKATDEELSNLNKAQTELNCKNLDIKNFTLPNGDKRCLIVFEKLEKTSPKYPRLYKAIKNNPLN